ncbi:MAG: hypothetical protein GY835_05225 [bacterium]|nr:hypothetical protein [bacterium]
MLLQSPSLPSQAKESLGLVGEAIESLAERYLLCSTWRPKPRHDRLEEFQVVKRRVVGEQLACWKVALAMRDAGPLWSSGPACLPPLDWPFGLTIEHHHLSGVLEEPLIEGHVHLGGVMGSLDLWSEILDPRLRRARMRHFRQSIHSLRDDTFGTRRLDSARTIRDLLTFELARIHATDFKTLSCLYGRTIEEFTLDVVLEQALVRGAEGAVAHLGVTLANRDYIPLALSPWWLQHKTSNKVDGALVSERAFLVRSFAAILGVYPIRPAPWFGPLLTAYLVSQNLFHRDVTQHGERVGLENFLQWYEEPLRSLRSGSHLESQKRVLDRISCNWRVRVEGRVTPNPDTIRSWIRAFRRRHTGRSARLGRDFGLVVHFIKERDPRTRRPAPNWEQADRTAIDDPPWLLRHTKLRAKFRSQCYELEHLRAVDPDAASAVVGIDAARGEEDTPPEVLAPAFRYLRRKLPNVGFGNSFGGSLEWLPPLRATFHVGESFHHPLTGLRMVHEALRFLDLRPGDRLGHAMALGIEPKEWLKFCGPPPHMTREERFDNLVWIALVLLEKGLAHEIVSNVENFVAREWEPLYGRESVPPPRSLTSLLGWAWKLRWMDPTELFAVLGRIGWDGGWPPLRRSSAAEKGHHRLEGNLHSCLQAGRCLGRDPHRPSPLDGRLCGVCRTRNWSRSPPVLDPTLSPKRLAWRLSTLDLEQLFSGEIPIASLRYLWCYQFDRSYYRRGRQVVEWPAEFDDWTELFEPLREAVLDEVSRRDLTIEACPSSNLAIGGFGDLTQHPIFQLDTYGLKNGSEREIRVTVNTDDPGIFATNLTNEYALLASAAEARGENPADVLRWIDHLRRRGLESTFLRPEGTEAYDDDDESWPPNLALYPHWRDREWRKFALAADERRETERGVERLRRLLLGSPE